MPSDKSVESSAQSEDEKGVNAPASVDEPESYEHVASMDEIPEMRPLVVEVNGHGVLLCLQDGEVRAMDEICPHKQLSMRHGFVHGGAMVCPHHQYKFDLQTGRSRRHKCQPAETFETHVEDGEVYVRKQGKLGR